MLNVKCGGCYMRSLTRTILLALILFIGTFAAVRADENHRLRNLKGEWKFRLGDNLKWADPKLNDNRWDEIYVPATWEDEGYPGYDGYAWYRKHFNVPSDWKTKDLFLELGMIDDVDEVYVNGQLIGSTGSFPPAYSSAYDVQRSYSIPQEVLESNKDNVIAVRVFDDHGVGGIANGSVGIYEHDYLVHPDLRFPAMWKFNTGDDPEWKEAAYDDHGWKAVRVPAYWEAQGFMDYDGYAWYRVKFRVPANYSDQNLILLVGKIDDFDETYLNGERVGRTGPMPKYKMDRPDGNEYEQTRTYMIPVGLLQRGKENVLAVRVYDCWRGGGIYDGPIGITTRQRYLKDRHWRRHVENWFDRVINEAFDW
jgi:hypothetical protein